MSTANPAPPGWYEASPGVQRWWDGASWTEHHRASAAPRVGSITWGGNAEVTLVLGIILAAVAGLFLLGALLSLVAFGSVSGFFMNLFGAAGMAAFAVVSILNSRGLNRQKAADRAYAQQVPPQR